ncbi:thiamine-phosphate pyrophosphorylase [Sphingomonas sp. BE138]|uniref:thiamine phosphate synthase n=1 Tax=Sphingomonas sp. BE138 TaxID=2817845 RepID=UPI00285F371A|nr:thiamine phosphate synthase [Sphingomonas sp. BE138]MDR6789085.1 thiamine-phosphate pyrophosphorylase [Sphingomonas sp. BE138]
MRARHPNRWLMTDERQGAGLWRALERLPRGAGVIFRHYRLPDRERRVLFRAVRRVARRRGLVLIVAGGGHLGRADGVHARRGRGLVTWPAHDRREAIAAVRAGAQIVLISPVHVTRSHPNTRALGPLRAAGIAKGLPVTRIALGGMDERRWRRIRALGFDGYAAIDAWSG